MIIQSQQFLPSSLAFSTASVTLLSESCFVMLTCRSKSVLYCCSNVDICDTSLSFSLIDASHLENNARMCLSGPEK